MKTSTLARRMAGAWAFATALASLPVHAQPFEYLGQQIVPSGTVFAGTTVGGLSGIDFLAGSGRYVAISDDRSAVNPARTYELTLDLSLFVRSGSPGQAGVQFQSVTTLLRPDGTPYPTNSLDPEGLQVHPLTGQRFWSNEGQRVQGAFQNPTVQEMNADGSHVRDLTIPSKFLPTGSASGLAAGDTGPYNNLAFESLSFSPDGKTLYTATENALVQDGLPATMANGSPARILSLDTATGQPGAEWVYPVTPVVLPPAVAGQFATNGLVELISLGEGRFLAMERSFAVGAASPGVGPNGLPTGYTVRLYGVDVNGATDVSGLQSLAGASYTPASKTLLLDLSDLRNDDGTPLALDNLEGMTLGPVVQGRQTLILVSDNNFGNAQFTQFVALAISPVPEPATTGLLCAGLLAGALVQRRRRTGAAAPA